MDVTFFSQLDEMAEGIYTEPYSDLPNYDTRSMAKEAEKLGRPLTEEEAKPFIREIVS